MRIKLLIYKTKGRFFGADAGLGPDSDDTELPVTRKMKDFLLSGKPAEAQLSETLRCPHFTPRERDGSSGSPLLLLRTGTTIMSLRSHKFDKMIRIFFKKNFFTALFL